MLPFKSYHFHSKEIKVISNLNAPLNDQSVASDFTTENYHRFLLIAKRNYNFVTYGDIPWGQKFILWRHDCDYSLERSYALARIEADAGVRSTYFLNPHSEFYNIFEKTQYRQVMEILDMGHDIGLHFDADFYDIADETILDDKIESEISVLKGLYGVKPEAFSFHNPGAAQLACEADRYGGAINCYSSRFKNEVFYCSDSNGYWRFSNLQDVLEGATAPCLQVLTHPGWWQEKEMPPRKRVFRCVYGRAAATLHGYDAQLERHNRRNHSGFIKNLDFLKALQPRLFDLYDYLWNSECLKLLFVELWWLHETQIHRLCKAELRKGWKISAADLNAFFEDSSRELDSWRLLFGVFGQGLQNIAQIERQDYKEWSNQRNMLISGRSTLPNSILEEGCLFLCKVIIAVAQWGQAQATGYHGLSHLGSIGLPTYKTEDGHPMECLEEMRQERPSLPNLKWDDFKMFMENGFDEDSVE